MNAPDEIRELTDLDRANIIAHLSPELCPIGDLPSPNSVMMDWVYQKNALADRDATIARLQAKVDDLLMQDLATLDSSNAERMVHFETDQCLQRLQARLDAGPTWTMVRLWASMVRDRGLRAEADIFMETANRMEAANAR